MKVTVARATPNCRWSGHRSAAAPRARDALLLSARSARGAAQLPARYPRNLIVEEKYHEAFNVVHGNSAIASMVDTCGRTNYRPGLCSS
ncbi:hypothetical protein [Nitrosococcus halophilus]|uniref:hypothetical protein n=1 Tax=Nitrosococcus halophilus TaxID=133539 RepID=UPI0012FE8B3B|nr:hypothetical protein [Nitrosococcus halophilus]